MADLSGNIDFDVLLDFHNGQIVITDTGSYPVGVEPTLKGIIKVTQPDGISVQGTFIPNPDIQWNGVDNLTVATKELRLNTQGKPQQGTYTIVYQIYDGVDITTLTRQFVLNYNTPKLITKESFDVFTPELQVTDITDYAQSGFAAPVTTRVWFAQIGDPLINTKVGSGASFDLGLAGVYYDAKYIISLATNLLYTHTSYPYLTVADRVSTSFETQANTPPSTDDLLAYVDAIKIRVDEKQPCGDDCCDEQCDYILAFTLYRHIRDRICKDQTFGEPALTDLIQQLLNIYYGYVKEYVNLNVPILAYTAGDCEGISGGGGGGGSTVVQLEYTVGAVGAPIDGQSTFAIPQIVGHDIVLFIGSIIQSKLDNGFGVFYSKPNSSDTITLTGQTWSNGSIIQILVL